MTRRSLYITIIPILFITGIASFSRPAAPVLNLVPENIFIDSTPEENYTAFCSGCHGIEMVAFVDRKWKHGNTRGELVNTIKNGHPEAGMPSFEKTFSEKDLVALADYIISGIKRMDRFKPASTKRPEKFTYGDFSVNLQTVTTDVNIPWGMDFLPDGSIIATDRSGKMFIIKKDGTSTTVTGVPEVVAEGQGGLLDVKLHPSFAKNNLVYISYSKGKKINGENFATTAVSRATLKGNMLTDSKIIFEAAPYTKTRHHYGSRLAFDKKGYLFISVGDRGNHNQFPQNLDNSNGKIHRIKDDGSIPDDNPFVGNKGAIASVFSYGHRNPQGMAVDPLTNKVWANEHGPRGGDEVNLVQKGKNYGWPVISYGLNYNGTVLTNKTSHEGMEQPVVYWIPSIAPSGMTFVTGDHYPKWKGALLSGSLRFNYVNLSVMDGNKIIREEMILKDIGRVRNIVQGPDGYIYISVENPGTIYRLMPDK